MTRLIPRDNSYVPRLTIYIPTIGRDTLPALLESIDIQFMDLGVMGRCDVWVSDNSEDGRAEAMCLPYAWCNYERQSHDIGVDANVMRAAVVGIGEFVWIIGDDDWILSPDIARLGEIDDRPALRRILDSLDRDLDRLILTSPSAAPWIPHLEDKVYSARELIESIRHAPSLLIAATLITANVYNRRVIDLAEGLRHWDSYYNFSWATSGAWAIRVLREPTIGVGFTHGCGIPNAGEVWQDYLDGLTIKAGCKPIDVQTAVAWNFANLAQRASRERVDA